MVADFSPLHTSRLLLVALAPEHAPAVFAYASDPEICALSVTPRHATLADSRRLIARAMVGYAQGGHYEWGVVRRSDGAFLGTCGFECIDAERGVAEFGYVLARAHWGQGYATEAVAAALAFGFTHLRLEAIEAVAFPANVASLQVLAKLGLRHVQTRPFDEKRGDQRPVQIWRVERGRWGQKRASTATPAALGTAQALTRVMPAESSSESEPDDAPWIR